MSVNIFKCSYCDVERYTRRHFLLHLEYTHQCVADFRVQCSIKGCPKTYRIVDSLRRHINRKHPQTVLDWDISGRVDDTESSQPCQIGDDSRPTSRHDCVTNDATIEKVVKTLKDSLMMFFLQLQEKHCVTMTVQQTVMDDVKAILLRFTQQYSGLVKFHVEKVVPQLLWWRPRDLCNC